MRRNIDKQPLLKNM